MTTRTTAALGVLLALTWQTSAQSELVLQGQPYSAGSMTLHLIAEDDIGEAPLLAIGLNPLNDPIPTGKGPFYIGSLVSVIGLPLIPAGGTLDVPFTLPTVTPGLEGITFVLQGFIGGLLSNPATVPSDLPYFLAADAQVIASPEPSVGALFGDRVTAGDLNGDDAQDLIVGAWFEDYLGIPISGRAYVLWGPSFTTHTTLSSPNPGIFAGFGGSVVTADLDKDGIDDLIVGELVSDPPTPPDTGTLYVYYGDPSFSATASFQLESPEEGFDGLKFGRQAVVGDFNGDTWIDIAESMFAAPALGFPGSGKIVVFWGPSFASFDIITSPDPGLNDALGNHLTTGDLNGDGLADIVAGSGLDDVDGVINQGSVHLFASPSLAPLASIPNPYPGVPFARFGDYVHAADLDGDGKAEVITRDDFDRVFVFWSPDYTSFHEIRKPPSVDANPEVGFFGYLLASADANDDGLRDVLIGDLTEGSMAGCADEGTGTLFVALAPYYSTFYRITDVPGSCGHAFADTGGIVAELDGDPQPELVITASSSDDGGIQNSGHVTVFGYSPGVP